MSIAATKPLTAEEFFALPDPKDGTRLELVRGGIVAMPGPGWEHSEVQGNTYHQIKLFLTGNPIGRVGTEAVTVVDRNPDSVRGPDVSYYSKERMPLGLRVTKYHDQPPDMCVEVVSPSNTKKELRAKIKEYFFAGVRMVWVVDPEDRSITVLAAPDEGRTFYEDAVFDGGDVLPGFRCKVSDLFA